MTSGSAAAAKAQSSEVCTTINGPEELQQAHALLAKLESTTTWRRQNVVDSLTVPRGEQYLDNTLVRFLRARKGDVVKAASMMDQALKFRRRFDVDNVLARPLAPELLKHVHQGIYEGVLPGFDKQGRPMYMLRGGASNNALHGLLETPPGHDSWSLGQLEDVWLHWHLQMMEYLTTVLFAEATKRKGSLVNKYVVIDDLKGFNLTGVKGLYNVISVFKKISWVDQLLYPEMLSLLFFTNSPAVFRGPWKIISGFVDADTNRKISVLGGAASLEPALDALYAKPALPDFLGGHLAGNHVTSKENPSTPVFDALHAKVDAAGRATGFDPALRSQEMQVLQLRAGAEAQVTQALQKGQRAEWQFVVDAHEVHVTGTFQATGGRAVVVDDPSGEDTGGVRLQGWYCAEEDGVFALRFSNKHSKLRSKTVRYRLFAWIASAAAEEQLPASAESNLQASAAAPTATPADEVLPAVEEGAVQDAACVPAAPKRQPSPQPDSTVSHDALEPVPSPEPDAAEPVKQAPSPALEPSHNTRDESLAQTA